MSTRIPRMHTRPNGNPANPNPEANGLAELLAPTNGQAASPAVPPSHPSENMQPHSANGNRTIPHPLLPELEAALLTARLLVRQAIRYNSDTRDLDWQVATLKDARIAELRGNHEEAYRPFLLALNGRNGTQ